MKPKNTTEMENFKRTSPFTAKTEACENTTCQCPQTELWEQGTDFHESRCAPHAIVCGGGGGGSSSSSVSNSSSSSSSV